jgi:(p)ppGpp synthase/HD superfamily hydrolase
MNIIQQAALRANSLHRGQKRAGGGPYIIHPARVASHVILLDAVPGVVITEEMVAAAWLHDVYEDTALKPPALKAQFGFTVNQYVVALTNVFTKENKPSWNRKRRKGAEIKRLAGVCPQAQLIKLCDRIDNLQTIRAKGRKFTETYCDESEALAEALTVAPNLQLEIFKLTRKIRKKIK